jgi:hypothetical protein
MTGGPPDRPIAPNRRPGRVGPVAVIEGFAGRRSVIPFAILVLGLLSLGLVILLLLNTALDRGAFELNAAQKRQSQLTDQQQELQLRLAALSAPGALASQAAALGMVPNPRPVFLDPNTGAVLGVPTAAPTTAVPKPAVSASRSPAASGSASASASASPSASVQASALAVVALTHPASASASASAPASAPASASASATASASASAPRTRP